MGSMVSDGTGDTNEVNLTSLAFLMGQEGCDCCLILLSSFGVDTSALLANSSAQKSRDDGRGALIYIISVLLLFAAPMLILLLRYLWGERESSRMEAFYSKILRDKPPRMILFDNTGRRLSKPELLSPSLNRKMTHLGISYKDGHFSPTTYNLRHNSPELKPQRGSQESPSIVSEVFNEKSPTIYLSDSKFMRWVNSLSPGSPSASTIVSETGVIPNKLPSTGSYFRYHPSNNLTDPNTPATPASVFTPSTPCSPIPFFRSFETFALKRMALDKVSQKSPATDNCTTEKEINILGKNESDTITSNKDISIFPLLNIGDTSPRDISDHPVIIPVDLNNTIPAKTDQKFETGLNYQNNEANLTETNIPKRISKNVGRRKHAEFRFSGLTPDYAESVSPTYPTQPVVLISPPSSPCTQYPSHNSPYIHSVIHIPPHDSEDPSLISPRQNRKISKVSSL